MPEPTWQKSSFCAQGNSCVHIATSPTGTVRLTESGDPAHSVLGASPRAFAALVHVLKEKPAHV
ncbi:DUF397 domain-containing protein [Streptomyces sp. BV286]|uniref:DUF397 domain-containing protein n=1 Tax=Streptomyces sp. BV286 TaxID=2849672 RepID=UPI001C2E9FCA|nr:DUF397 domain-containing protein [Streptomyces sp. BV286]MBV1935328.1 DUF397 domain-containing protein [Streptomyces sp. BV286]